MSHFRYWGKAKPSGPGSQCHLLPYHSLDVAAVGWLLLAPERPLAQLLAERLDMPPEALRHFFVFLLGLHDLGKFSRTFQGLARPEGVELVAPDERLTYDRKNGRHDRLGALLWQECWGRWLRDGALGWSAPLPERHERVPLGEAMRAVLAPFFGHHGQPVNFDPIPLDQAFLADDIEAARAFVADWAALIEPGWPADRLVSPAWLDIFRALSWIIAGWATLSDWLGSDREHFPYWQDKISLAEYWSYALESAQSALHDAGLDQLPQPVAYAGMASWFGTQEVTPTPLQREAESLVIGEGPQLFILEDVTGAGKTEAACILAQRLLAAGYGEGLYFALPTMATSNAMYARLGRLHHRFYTADSQPSLVLAHGARELNEAYARSISRTHPSDHDYSLGEATATVQCNRWLADSRKKALLAEVGVGTIDQALMGVLPFRHQSLRLYGLARKVLIVDEVHEHKARGSAQGIAAGTLAEACGRTLTLTGTLLGGYASTLFHLLWRFTGEVREEFAHGEEARWVARYGLVERITKRGDNAPYEDGRASRRRAAGSGRHIGQQARCPWPGGVDEGPRPDGNRPPRQTVLQLDLPDIPLPPGGHETVARINCGAVPLCAQHVGDHQPRVIATAVGIGEGAAALRLERGPRGMPGEVDRLRRL